MTQSVNITGSDLPISSGWEPALSGRVWLAGLPWHPDAVCSQTLAFPLSSPDEHKERHKQAICYGSFVCIVSTYSQHDLAQLV